MKDNIREQIDIFKNFRSINEAVKTKCQTEGAIYNTDISENKIGIDIKIPFNMDLTKTEAKLLEDNIHNALELVLKPYFMKNL
jgi:hypothetical protein